MFRFALLKSAATALGILAAGCASSNQTNPATQPKASVSPGMQKVPSAVHPGNLRDPLLERRIAVGLTSLAAVSKLFTAWKRPANELMVFDEKQTWYLGPKVPGGFKEVGTIEAPKTLHLGHAPASLQLTGKTIPYQSIRGSLVGTVMWAQESPGPDGAKPALRPVFLIRELDALAADHPAFEADTSVEEWLALFVHEYFHAYQFSQHNLLARISQFKPEQKKALDGWRKADAAYDKAIRAEYAVLSGFINGPKGKNQKAARAALTQWWKLYQDRRTRFLAPKKLEQFDLVYTYLEGVARYVEVRFLREQRFHEACQSLKDDPRWRAFAAFAGKGPLELSGRSLGNFYYYQLGMALAFALDVASPKWRTTVADHPELLIGEVRDLVAAR